MVAPVKNAAGEAVQLVIGGLTEDPSDAPGPFGNYLLATTHDMNWTTKSGGAGPIMETQDWVFTAASGERLEMHITYQRGVAAKRNMTDTKFYPRKILRFIRSHGRNRYSTSCAMSRQRPRITSRVSRSRVAVAAGQNSSTEPRRW
jgi:hypothetical protein